MMSDPPKERRGAARARVNLHAVEYRGDTSYLHPVVYLSATGMLIRDASFTLERLVDGSDLDFEIGLPGIDKSLRMQGRIARIEPTDEGELGVGVEFVDLSTRDAECVDIYVQGVLDGAAAARAGRPAG